MEKKELIEKINNWEIDKWTIISYLWENTWLIENQYGHYYLTEKKEIEIKAFEGKINEEKEITFKMIINPEDRYKIQFEFEEASDGKLLYSMDVPFKFSDEDTDILYFTSDNEYVVEVDEEWGNTEYFNENKCKIIE